MKHDAIDFIKRELEVRLEKNPQYSLRSFAQLLQLNIGTLSSLLNRKRVLTGKTLDKICDRLAVSPEEKNQIFGTLKKAKAATAQAQYDETGVLKSRLKLEHDTYKAISEWYHWAILQLVRLDHYGQASKHKSAKWFATRLGIPEVTAKMAVERLVELQLLKVVDGFYRRTTAPLTTKNKSVTSPALRQWQKGLREKAIESLEQDPIEKRSMTSLTLAIDPAMLPEARVMIEEFQEKLNAFFDAGKKENVYQLTVSLFPLEKGESK